MLPDSSRSPRLASASRRRITALALGLLLPALINLTAAQGASAAPRISVGRGAKGAAPSQVQVTTADDRGAQAAGVHGVLFSLRAKSGGGNVSVDVDESTFRNTYGGGFASRLRLVQLPACALTT